jgi:hypothetical protein
VEVPRLTTSLTTPVEEALWSLLWEPPTDQPETGEDWLGDDGESATTIPPACPVLTTTERTRGPTSGPETRSRSPH